MWYVDRSEHWNNLSGFGGTESHYVGTANLPDRPKAAEIRREVNRIFAEYGFRAAELDLTLRSAGVITGDLERTEPESRNLDEFHCDTFTLYRV